MVNINQQEKVSIIIPSYNVEKYIYRAIESCINQTYDNIEIVIVDDGSSDKTWDIIQKYEKSDLRIKAIKKNNNGVSSARNLALKNASGDYVIFLDSDDWIEKDTIATLITKVASNSNVLICCDRSFIYEDKMYEIIPQVTKFYEEKSNDFIEWFSNGKGNLQSSCYKLFNLKIIKEHNILFNENIYHGEDGLFVFEYLNCVNSIYYFSKCLWNILVRSGSATNSGYNEKWLTAIDAAKIISNYREFSEKDKKSISKYCINRAIAIKIAMLNEKNKAIPDYDKKKLKEFFDKNIKCYIKSEDSIVRKVKVLVIMKFPRSIITFYMKKINSRRSK